MSEGVTFKRVSREKSHGLQVKILFSVITSDQEHSVERLAAILRREAEWIEKYVKNPTQLHTSPHGVYSAIISETDYDENLMAAFIKNGSVTEDAL